MLEEYIDLGEFRIHLVQRPDGQGYWGALKMAEEDTEDDVYMADLGRCDHEEAIKSARRWIMELADQCEESVMECEKLLWASRT